MVPNRDRMRRCLRRWMYSLRAVVTASFLVRWRPSFWASLMRRSSRARLVGMATQSVTHRDVWCQEDDCAPRATGIAAGPQRDSRGILSDRVGIFDRLRAVTIATRFGKTKGVAALRSL